MNKRQHDNRRFVPVLIKTSPKDNRIIVNREIRYKDVAVYKGYKSDGLTKLINKYAPNCIRAAIVHDFICDGAVSTETGKRVLRKIGDKYFLEILKLDGVSWFKRKRMYWAVSAYRIATFKK